MICKRNAGKRVLNLAFHLLIVKDFVRDARYNRLLNFGFYVRPSPLQSVRRAFFPCRTVVILHRGPTWPQEPSRRASETFGSNSSSRLFPIARWERGVPLSDKLRFVRQRSSLCEAGDAPKSRPFFKLYYGYQPKTDRQDRQEAPNAEL